MKLFIEQLETRNCPSTVSVVGGTIQYVADVSETNNVTLSHVESVYTVHDSGAVIAAPTAPGWTGNGTNTVTVDGSVVPFTGIAVDLSANANRDICNVRSIDVPTSVAFGDGITRTNVCSNAPNTGNMDGIQATLSVNVLASTGFNTLWASDFSGTTGRNVSVGASSITGFGPGEIDYSGRFHQIRLIGSGDRVIASTYTVDNPTCELFQIDTTAGTNTFNFTPSPVGGATITLNGPVSSAFGSDTLNYYVQPGETPVNNGSTITDTSGGFATLYFHNIATVNLV